MADQYEYIAALAEEAEKLLMTNTVFRKSLETDDRWKRELFIFVREARDQARIEELSSELESRAEAPLNLEKRLPPESREPSFRCIASHKACMKEAISTGDKVLCGLALVICFAKEVIPLA